MFKPLLLPNATRIRVTHREPKRRSHRRRANGGGAQWARPLSCPAQAVRRRRRAKARRPPQAKIRPGRPAPTMGPGTAAGRIPRCSPTPGRGSCAFGAGERHENIAVERIYRDRMRTCGRRQIDGLQNVAVFVDHVEEPSPVLAPLTTGDVELLCRRVVPQLVRTTEPGDRLENEPSCY